MSTDIDYLQDHKVPELMENLMSQLLSAKPESPYMFLRQVLNKPKVLGIAINGAPASGKGVQSEKLVQAYGVVHVSTGDLIRAEIKAQSALGKEVEDLVKTGQLVPDELLMSLLRNRIDQQDVRERGYLLDGAPRTANQAKLLREAGVFPNAFILLDVPDDVVKTRISGRRQDPVTGKSYHLVSKPPPNDPAILERLVTRKDDTPEAIETRLATYHKNEDLLIENYQSVLVKVNGNRTIEEVGKDVVEAVKHREFK